MNDTNGTSVPELSPISSRTPSKPKPTTATFEQLVGHYNSQLPAYQALGVEPAMVALTPAQEDLPSKEDVIELIRKQNYRLKRFIRARSIELLQEVVDKKDGRTVGRSYADILDILAVEFPEASTSAACLRWYVVHLWSEADEEGLPRPVMPQFRPRSTRKKVETAVEEAPQLDVAA